MKHWFLQGHSLFPQNLEIQLPHDCVLKESVRSRLLKSTFPIGLPWCYFSSSLAWVSHQDFLLDNRSTLPLEERFSSPRASMRSVLSLIKSPSPPWQLWASESEFGPSPDKYISAISHRLLQSSHLPHLLTYYLALGLCPFIWLLSYGTITLLCPRLRDEGFQTFVAGMSFTVQAELRPWFSRGLSTSRRRAYVTWEGRRSWGFSVQGMISPIKELSLWRGGIAVINWVDPWQQEMYRKATCVGSWAAPGRQGSRMAGLPCFTGRAFMFLLTLQHVTSLIKYPESSWSLSVLVSAEL